MEKIIVAKASSIESKVLGIANLFLLKGKNDNPLKQIYTYIEQDRKLFENFLKDKEYEEGNIKLIIKQYILLYLKIDSIKREDILNHLKEIESIVDSDLSKEDIRFVMPLFCFIVSKYNFELEINKEYIILNKIKKILLNKIVLFYEYSEKELLNETLILYILHLNHKKDDILEKINTKYIFKYLFHTNSYMLFTLYYNGVEIKKINIKKRVRRILTRYPSLIKSFLEININLLTPQLINFINEFIEKYISERDKKVESFEILDSYKNKAGYEFRQEISIKQNFSILNETDIDFKTEEDFYIYMCRIINLNFRLEISNEDYLFDTYGDLYDSKNEKIKDKVDLKLILFLEWLKSIDLTKYFLTKEIKDKKYGNIDEYEKILDGILKVHKYYKFFEDEYVLIKEILLEGYKGNWYIFCGIIPLFEKIIREIIVAFSNDKRSTLGYKEKIKLYHEKALSTLIRENKDVMDKIFDEQVNFNMDMIFGDKMGNLRNIYCHGLLDYENDKNLIMHMYSFMMRFFLCNAGFKEVD